MYDIRELQLLKAALDIITIKGSDAKFVATLQDKLDEHIKSLATPPASKK